MSIGFPFNGDEFEGVGKAGDHVDTTAGVLDVGALTVLDADGAFIVLAQLLGHVLLGGKISVEFVDLGVLLDEALLD